MRNLDYEMEILQSDLNTEIEILLNDLDSMSHSERVEILQFLLLETFTAGYDKGKSEGGWQQEEEQNYKLLKEDI